MLSFIAFLTEQSKRVFYHGTSTVFLNSIRQYGLQVSKGNVASITQNNRPVSVFVTMSATEAIRYAWYAADKESRPIILQIQVPSTNVDDCVKDEVDRPGTYRCEHDIPAQWIEKIIEVNGMSLGSTTRF